MRRGREVRLPQLERHVLELRVIEPLPEARVGAVAAEEDRLEDERANDPGMPERDLQRDVTAVAVAEEVGLRDMQVPEQLDGILGGSLEGEGTVHVRGVAVSLLLERDHLSRLRDQRDELAERGLDGGAAAVKQHQRDAVLRRIAVDLVIELETVEPRRIREPPGPEEHALEDAARAASGPYSV